MGIRWGICSCRLPLEQVEVVALGVKLPLECSILLGERSFEFDGALGVVEREEHGCFLFGFGECFAGADAAVGHGLDDRCGLEDVGEGARRVGRPRCSIGGEVGFMGALRRVGDFEAGESPGIVVAALEDGLVPESR